MIVEFMFNNIKNIELIYLMEEKYDENFGDNIKEEKYLGTDYCRNIMDKLQSKRTITECRIYCLNS